MNSDSIDSKGETLKLFRRNISWSFMSNVIYAICQWGILVIIAKYGTQTMVGQFTLGLFVTAPIIMLANLQLRSVQATETENEYTFGDYLGLRIITSILFVIILIFVLTLFKYDKHTSLVILAVGVAKIIEMYSDVVYGLLQKNERMDIVSISKIIKGVLSLIVMFLFLKLSHDILISTIGLAIMWLFVMLVYDFSKAKLFNEIHIAINGTKLWELLKLTIPLGIIQMLSSLNTNIPRYFLERSTSIELLGYYSALVYLLVAGNTIIAAIGQSVLPRLARIYSQKDKRNYQRIVYKLILIGFFIGIIGTIISLLFGREILTILYNKDYAEYTNVLVIIMFSSIFAWSGSFLGYANTAARYFNIQPILGLIWVFTSAIASYLIIPSYGIIGASVVMIISSIIQLFSRLLVNRYTLKSLN